LIPDIEKFLPVAIFKMATTIPHKFNIVRLIFFLIWCSAKHFSVSIAMLIDFFLLFCFYFACIIIATFSVCLSITQIYKLHFFTLTCIILPCIICFILPCIFRFYLNKDLYKSLILTSIYVVFMSPYALCFNITMHYFY
jgi:hypothetical protein